MDPEPPSVRPAGPTRPRIVVTLAALATARVPGSQRRKNERYLEAIARAGGEPLALDEDTDPAAREAALERMQGLLLSGGADLSPTLYGQAPSGAKDPQIRRDLLEQRAYMMATRRGSPVLGICRGLQAVNVFEGGSLIQHVDGHTSPEYPTAAPRLHALRLLPRTRLGDLLTDGDGRALLVNSYHHQAVGPAQLAPGLRAAGFADHDATELVEALEAADPQRWVMAVQCHPERTESTPPAFERLFAAFVRAAAMVPALEPGTAPGATPVAEAPDEGR